MNKSRLGVQVNVGDAMLDDLTFSSTVFQSYQDDERLIMSGCVQWNPVYS